MCCSSAKWKREVVPDHKFDFIDVGQFRSRACGSRLSFALSWFFFFISLAVYVADTYTLIALLASNRWSGQILQSEAAQGDTNASNVLEVPFNIGKWIFFGCIVLSYLLLLWEARKARAIVKSRDISYAFTNVMAHEWYALRSYDHHCFFGQIEESKKKKDSVAFWVFFTFKGWKRLLLCDAPRQVINAITLWSFGKSQQWTTDLSVYFSGSLIKKVALITMSYTVIIFAISAVCLLIASALYVPLLCYIQGNLKEYCCHKVDKRIAELMKRKAKRRLKQERELEEREARGDFRHLKGRAPRPQPTLPKIGLADDDLVSDIGSVRNEKFAPDLLDYPPSIPYGNSAPYRLSRHAPYPSTTDIESLKGGQGYSYAESVSSLDGLAAHSQPMGYEGSYAGSGVAAQSMSRLPSYRTNPSSGNLPCEISYERDDRFTDCDAPENHGASGYQQYGQEHIPLQRDERWGRGHDERERDDRDGTRYGDKLASLDFSGASRGQGYRSETPALDLSLSSRTGDYHPPSRRDLLERAERHNNGSHAGHAGSFSTAYGGAGAYSGWEEGGPYR
ncbi:vacuole protein [Rhodotorula toruloides]|uniref:Vacuole protein n=1 Tax=Rhodotorula toruloides TaxID=5286 RepID=A0A511KPE6_RHOTO|nr:vacuole protein [Rhodotorula toruloides]